MIHDDARALIIENKVHAKDQLYQITRYVRYVQDRLFIEGEDLSDRIAIVYLSKIRVRPSVDSKSLIGFELDNSVLHWVGVPDDETKLPAGSRPNLAPGTRMPFVHLPYFPGLNEWARKCAEIAPLGGVRNAFDEYLLVLERLKGKGKWKKIMNLDEYMMAQPEQEQKEMYAFMIEASKLIDQFIQNKLFSGMVEMFGEQSLENSGDFKLFTPENLKSWLRGGRGDWKRVGFVIYNAEGRRIGFVLAEKYAYFGVLDSGKHLWAGDEAKANRVRGGDVRDLLKKQSDGIYVFMEDVKRRAVEYGVSAGCSTSL
ncbi:hypothetical protein GCM10027514_33840 [Azotobacter armeniacus]